MKHPQVTGLHLRLVLLRLDCLTIFLLVWECLLPLGYSAATSLPLYAVFAGRWLLIWLLGYYVAVSSPQCTYALCSVRFVIVERWLLWPFYVACFPAACGVSSSFLHWSIDRHPWCTLPINIFWLIDQHLLCALGLCDYAIRMNTMFASHNCLFLLFISVSAIVVLALFRRYWEALVGNLTFVLFFSRFKNYSLEVFWAMIVVAFLLVCSNTYSLGACGGVTVYRLARYYTEPHIVCV